MTRRPADQRSDPDAPSTHDHVDVELEWEVGALRLPDRWRRGVTVVLHPNTARIGALVRARDLHKGTLLEAITRTGDSDHGPYRPH